MTYVTGSRITQANPAEDFYNIIAAQLQAHGNYEFVETRVISTTTHHVWRCRGVSNSMGADYVIIFSRTTAAGSTQLNMGLAEVYNSSNGQYTRPFPNFGSGAITPAADSSYSTNSFALNATSASETSLYRAVWTLSTSAYDYWLVVTNDGFWANVRVGSSLTGALVCTYDKLINPPSADVFPVVIMQTAGLNETTSFPIGGCTRHPLVTTSQTRLWGVRAQAALSVGGLWTRPVSEIGPAVGDPGSLWQEGRPMASRVVVQNWATVTTYNPATTGDIRGLYRHMLASRITGAVITGDTITIGSDVYVGMGWSGGNYMTWFNTSAP